MMSSWAQILDLVVVHSLSWQSESLIATGVLPSESVGQ